MKPIIFLLVCLPLSLCAQQRSYKIAVDSTGSNSVFWSDGTPLTVQETYELKLVDPTIPVKIVSSDDITHLFTAGAISLGLSSIYPVIISYVPFDDQDQARIVALSGTIILAGLGATLTANGSRLLRNFIPVATKDGVGFGIILE